MKPAKNVKLVKATYVKDYVYNFYFSNGKSFDTDFKPLLLKGENRDYLNITKFKKIKFDERGNIYWGKNWDICFRLETYYGESKITSVPKKHYTNYLKRVGLLDIKNISKE